jgi:hypothetical protein
MSATATATYTAPVADHFAFSFHPTDRFPTRPTDRFGRSYSENAAAIVKSSISRARGNAVMADDIVVPPEGSESSRASTPNAQSQKWLRRFSTSISKSRDSSRTPNSRPMSAVISHSNGSLAFSHSGSTTPMLASIESTAQPRNRLVKRSSSVRGVSDSPSQNPGSRLPVPTFKRPATSHQRSATLHERPSAPLFHARMFSSDVSGDARDPHWRHYFTPKVARVNDTSSLRRPSISGIPNPIKRIYPDRRYTPTLVSAQQYIRQGDVEADDELSVYDVSEAVTPVTMPTSEASSPPLRWTIDAVPTLIFEQKPNNDGHFVSQQHRSSPSLGSAKLDGH